MLRPVVDILTPFVGVGTYLARFNRPLGPGPSVRWLRTLVTN
jgi:hypothetical protein